jgi:hypothetical protein
LLATVIVTHTQKIFIKMGQKVLTACPYQIVYVFGLFSGAVGTCLEASNLSSLTLSR